MKKPMKIQPIKEWQWLVGVGVSILAHNLLSGLIGREEVVFFGLTFIFLLGFIISILNRWLKNYWLVMLILIVLGLDFAALDDITTGNEPNYFGEYTILAISIPIFFFVFKWAFRKKKHGR